MEDIFDSIQEKLQAMSVELYQGTKMPNVSGKEQFEKNHIRTRPSSLRLNMKSLDKSMLSDPSYREVLRKSQKGKIAPVQELGDLEEQALTILIGEA